MSQWESYPLSDRNMDAFLTMENHEVSPSQTPQNQNNHFKSYNQSFSSALWGMTVSFWTPMLVTDAITGSPFETSCTYDVSSY